MEANELRIGNYVYTGGLVVKSYSPDGLHNLMRNIEEGTDKIKPIPLNQEWLFKFGFEMYEFDNKANQFRFKERLIVYRDGFLYDYGTSVKLQYVHQLQNLYFALTGEELI